MMGSFMDKFNTFLGKQTSDAKQELIGLAKRVAGGDEIDNAALPGLFARANSTAKDFQDLVAVFHDLIDLEKRAKMLDAAGKNLSALRSEGRSLAEQFEKVKRAHHQTMADLDVKIGAAINQLEAAEKARRKLQCVQYEHREMLGIDIDLDKCLVTSGGCVADPSDPSAPEQEVPSEVFVREHRRRCEIMQAARQAAQREYVEAMKKWSERAEFSISGRLLGGGPEPTREMPTWGDLVRRGLPAREPKPQLQEA